MADNKPVQILEALKEQLGSIATEDGYNTDVVNVHIGIRNPSRLMNLPVLDISSDGTDHEHGPAGNTVSSLTVVIRGYVSPSDTAESDMWDLIEDICDALSTNITLSLPFVMHTLYDETATDNSLEILGNSVRMVFVLATVHYEHDDEEF